MQPHIMHHTKPNSRCVAATNCESMHQESIVVPTFNGGLENAKTGPVRLHVGIPSINSQTITNLFTTVVFLIIYI